MRLCRFDYCNYAQLSSCYDADKHLGLLQYTENTISTIGHVDEGGNRGDFLGAVNPGQLRQRR